MTVSMTACVSVTVFVCLCVSLCVSMIVCACVCICDYVRVCASYVVVKSTIFNVKHSHHLVLCKLLLLYPNAVFFLYEHMLSYVCG